MSMGTCCLPVEMGKELKMKNNLESVTGWSTMWEEERESENTLGKKEAMRSQNLADTGNGFWKTASDARHRLPAPDLQCSDYACLTLLFCILETQLKVSCFYQDHYFAIMQFCKWCHRNRLLKKVHNVKSGAKEDDLSNKNKSLPKWILENSSPERCTMGK